MRWGDIRKNHLTRPVMGVMALGVFLVAAGCARKKGDQYLTECVFNGPEKGVNDQSGTFFGRWPVAPVPVALHTGGGFSSYEQNAISSAATTWNEFHSFSRGFSLVNAGSDTSINTSSQPRPANVCANGIISGSSFTGSVVIYKRGDWPHDPDIIALTSYCRIPDSPLNRIYTGIIELNYKNFFISGKKIPDLESIVLHELGHLVGLNHSCEFSGSTSGTPDCSNSGLDPDYTSAVMYPKFNFYSGGYGEVKNVLQDNDMGRANCLYEDL